MTWEHDARCRSHDPEIFFVPRVAFERRAKTICSRCPVRGECLVTALETRMEFGIWGGLSDKERRKVLRSAPRGTDWRERLAEKPLAG